MRYSRPLQGLTQHIRLPLHQFVNHMFRSSSDFDIRFENYGSVSTIRVVSTPHIDIRFFDTDGNPHFLDSHQKQPYWQIHDDFYLKSQIQKAVESRPILRFVDGYEENGETDGVDDEWDDKSDMTSEENEEDQEEDAPTEEVTEEGDRDSYDPDLDIKSEYSLDSIDNIGRLHHDLSEPSDTDDALSSDEREIVKRAHRKRRKKIATKYNRKNNTSRTPKYPIQPPVTTISLRLVKVRTICRLFGEMDATVECILHFVRSNFVSVRSSFDQILSDRLAVFLSKPEFLLDVEVKKMRRTGQTLFESTVVESVEVVADVEVRSEIVEVSVRVVSGLMECSEMEGTLKEDHFSFFLPFSSSFLSLERLLRDQLPQLGNVCWFAKPINPFDELRNGRDYNMYTWIGMGGKMIEYDIAILNPNQPIFVRNEFSSLPIRLTAVESLLPDSRTRLVSIDGTRKAFVSWTHSVSPLALVWPPTDVFTVDHSPPPDSLNPYPPFPPHSLLTLSFITDNPFLHRIRRLVFDSISLPTHNSSTIPNPLDISSIYEPLNLRRRQQADQTILKSEQDNHSQSTASPNGQREESQSPLRLWIETPMRRVMGLFAGSATVHDVLFFVGSLNCVSVCAPLSFHEHALFAGDEKLDGLVTVSEILRTFGSVVSFRPAHVDSNLLST
ncbi:hypothetical protein BLNAU_23052 [Blattamonas nauphoetae]|uniref:EF-hand domain-containing protein n=1 Tax=Blattamonas nauphoetae TaxID=2049346 RepID=A0ABQ9WRA2_9EUKA|nr:hypothetical protein BLNAU_23052 [Blattamonas nauphoetae]